MTDRRSDWRLYLKMSDDRVTHGNGWVYVFEGTARQCGAERRARAIGPDGFWVDSTIRRPEVDPRMIGPKVPA